MNTDLSRLMKLMQTERFKVTQFLRATKHQNCNNSKTQEWELTCQVNDLIMDHGLNLRAVLSCDENTTGIRYNTLLDLQHGDIFIYETKEGQVVGSPLMYIDVKVAFVSAYRFTFATITRRSFDNFANREKHYYWCFNMDGSKSILIDSVKFYNAVNINDPWNNSLKPGCENNRNEDWIMGTWIHGYRKFFEVNI